jgi:hypothetical protein
MIRQEPDRANVRESAEGDAPDGADTLPLAADGNGAFPIRIARDGVWFYRGSPIRRIELASFTAVELAVEGEGQEMMLRFRNNFGDWVTAGSDHPIAVTFDPESGEPSPYVRVRDGLDALIVRSVYYQLADIAVPARRDGRAVLGVWSDGVWFELGDSA